MHVAIIGNGVSGSTAAIYLRKTNPSLQITLISDESPYFFARTALMYVYMRQLSQQSLQVYPPDFWDKQAISRLHDSVRTIDFSAKKIFFQPTQAPLFYDKLLLATGATPRKINCDGNNLNNIFHFYSLQDLEKIEKSTQTPPQNAIIIGGGLIGIEVAEMLYQRNIPVTVLVREEAFWANVLPPQTALLVQKYLQQKGIPFKNQTEVSAFLGDKEGKIRALITQKGEEISCDWACVCIGVRPNIDFLRNTPLHCDKGIVVNDFFQTNIPDVYAAGDCVQFFGTNKKTESLWYSAKLQGELAADNIAAKARKYAPPIWFNSAKFFDISYQTYGSVNAKLAPNEKEIYWQHAHKPLSIQLVYQENNRQFLGVNLIGIRGRQAVYEQFLREKQTIDYVLKNLLLAHYDSEFSPQWEREMQSVYMQQNP
ncbi:MAG: FAD/NAD(P)-binding oxidoreductase [Chitinophagales bacterium]|nr:NAD(P)/FAD-dependent oxidoreductase [Bacteroidota bacterium]MCB9043332.1 NAD(P)/FAD-dependent oxidoreductase [Chitinophagales bacterium]